MSSRSFPVSMFALVGTIIGAGAFALPGLFARAGLWRASLWFWALAFLIALMHVFYVEVILAANGSHRLPGHVRLVLGKGWAAFASFTHFFQIYGAHVVYLLLAGAFLRALAADAGASLPVPVGMLLLFLFGFFALRGGLRKMARLEFWLVALKIVLFLAAAGLVLGRGPAPTRFVAAAGWETFGLILFSLSGLPLIGEVVELCGRRRKPARLAAGLGTLLSALVMWVFALAFAWAGGTGIGSDPLSLASVLPGGFGPLLPVLGLLAVGTAYLSTGEDLQATWIHDYRFRFSSALATALVPPLICALFLSDGFLLLATVIGTVCCGANGVLVGMMRVALAERRGQALAVVGALAVVFAYAFGMSGQVVTWLFV